VEVDSDGAVQEFQTTDREGRPMGEPTRHRSSWIDLQHYASQPASAAVIDEAIWSCRSELGVLALQGEQP
jgi:hypothetical protein